MYADGASVADPAGATTLRTRAEIQAWYSQALKTGMTVVRTGPVCAADATDAAAAPLRATIPTAADAVSTLDAVDVFTFDQHGKITSMTAYWGAGTFEPPVDTAS